MMSITDEQHERLTTPLPEWILAPPGSELMLKRMQR